MLEYVYGFFSGTARSASVFELRRDGWHNCDVCLHVCLPGPCWPGASRASPTVTQCLLLLLQSNASCLCHWLPPVHAPIGSTTKSSSNAASCVLSLLCGLVHEQPGAGEPTASVCYVHHCRHGCTCTHAWPCHPRVSPAAIASVRE